MNDSGIGDVVCLCKGEEGERRLEMEGKKGDACWVLGDVGEQA